MDMRIPPLKLKILLESNPPKSRGSVRRSAVPPSAGAGLVAQDPLLPPERLGPGVGGGEEVVLLSSTMTG